MLKEKVDELKNCPFCNGTNISLQKTTSDNSIHDYIYQVYCRMCWANVGWHDSQGDAIEAWNKRYKR